SVKDTAKKLADGIFSAYKDYLQPGETVGLFSESGEPYWWYEAGLVWNSLVEYSYLTGDKQYDDIVSEALVWQIGQAGNAPYQPANQTRTEANEDQIVWALAALTAAETGFKEPKNIKWLDLAKGVFDAQTQRWDGETCGGGLRWQMLTFNAGYDWKNSATNAAFFLLSARLAAVTGNKTYSEWAEKSYKWSRDVGLISESYDVFDGTNVRSGCSDVTKSQWTSVHAMYIEGSASRNSTFPAEGLATRFRDKFISEPEKVLVEAACEERNICDTSMRFLKGIAARFLWRAGATSTPVSDALDASLRESAKKAAQECEGQGTELTCRFVWAGENREKSKVAEGGLPEVFNALSVVQGRLYKKAGANASAGGSPVINPSASPSGGSPSGSPSGTPTGFTAPPQGTGAAGRITVAWIGATLAAMLFAAGM
ncbi:glycoside hydrolase, partial [Westerdykella ornata]